MSTAAGAPSNGTSAGLTSPQSKVKGKGKSTVASPDVSMEEEDDDEDEEDEDEDEDMEFEEEEDDEEDDEEEIDPSAIIGRRTRGLKVDYTSKEALEKAGLTGNAGDGDDDDETK